MSKLNIKEYFQINIDSIPDEIDFKLGIFNEGRYDKDELRTVIRNTGMELKIINNSFEPMIISNIYFGIVKGKDLIKIYNSSRLNELLPSTLYSGGESCFYFYGWEIKEILQKEKDEDEDGVFILSANKEKNYYRSSKFNGKNLEEKLIYLENNEIANWGNEKYNPLDVETYL